MKQWIALLQKWLGRDAYHADWPFIRRQWMRSRFVYRGRSGPAAKLARPFRVFLRVLVRPDAESLFYKHCNDSDPRVAAYCLLGLAWLNSDLVLPAADSMRERSESIESVICSFVLGEELSSFADHVAERHREGNSLETWNGIGWVAIPDTLARHLQELRTFVGICE